MADDTAPKPKKRDDDAILAEARRRWKKCDEAESEQRKAILNAKQFRAGDQWPTDVRIAREGGGAIQGQAPQPPRPCLTIDRLSSPVRQISNQIKTANFAIDVLPNGFGADTETAEIFKGYIRRVQNNSRGESPVEWAADQAVEGGIGWFRLMTDYVYESIADLPPNDPAVFDQELRLGRITNNLSVYCDPSSLHPTRRTAQFMLVTEDLDKDEFKVRWPKANVQGVEEFCATGDMQGWVSADTIRIAEYWRVVLVEETVEGTDGRSRVVKAPKVEGYKITATEILEEWQWLGSRIPIFPILGEELNVDGKPVLRGVIGPGMDAQRMVNYTYSGAIEIFALAPKTPFVIAEGQLEGYEAIWQNANRVNFSYLPYKPTTIAGTAVAPPERQVQEAPIQAAVMLMAQSEDAIKATTGYYDPGLGNTNPREKSGRAIQALQGQSELGSSNYPDNVRRALIDCGNEMVLIAPKLTRPGQVLQILGVDDQPEQVMVGMPYQEQGGQIQPLPQVSPEQAKMQKGLAKFYDLKAGRYAVTCDVGKATATKREEGAAALGELIPHLSPPQQAVAMPEYVKQLSFPGAQKIAEKLQKTLPPELQDDAEELPIPPQVRQQLQQAQQMIQMLSQELEARVKQIETEQVKAEQRVAEIQAKEAGENQRELAKIAADERQAALDNLTKLAIAEITAQTQLSKLHAEQVRDELGFQHEHREAAMDRMQGAVAAERERAFQSTQSAEERAFQSREAAEDRAMAPEPAE